MLYQYLYKSTEENLLVSIVYSEIQENVAEFVVSVVVQFTWISVRRKQVKDRHRDKVGLLKSLIYDNAKATVTLDSSALKQLIQLSSDNCKSKIKSNLKVIL